MVESAAVRILRILLFEPLCNFYEVPSGVLRGSGHALYPALCTMTGTCAFRIIWICTVFRAAPSLPVLCHAFPLSWAATILLISGGFLLFRRSKSIVKTQLHKAGVTVDDGKDGDDGADKAPQLRLTISNTGAVKKP